MIASIYDRFERLRVRELLEEHRGLRIVPSQTDTIILQGIIQFHASGAICEVIEDQYELEIYVPPDFPDSEPLVRETAGRIPFDFHKLEQNFLCLGSPTEIRMRLREDSSLPSFVKSFVIPYLYGFSYYERHGILPFGELAHGTEGIRDHLSVLFCAHSSSHPEEFLRLAGLKKRVANKLLCPCGSRNRLGRCHNQRVNDLRKHFGRKWFQAEFHRVVDILEK